jgi:shikimate dehydrogenase
MTHKSNASGATSDALRISGSTRVCAIIGDPIRHTLSPFIHNAAFRSLKLDLVYVPFHVRRSELAAAIDGFRSLGVLGINVTMPHKSQVMRFLDKIENTAKKIGAVNTIVTKNAKLHGYNTDGEAAITALSRLGSLSGRKALILGAGGAARAIAYQLSKTADSIVILNRTRSNGMLLASNITKWNGIPSSSNDLNRSSLRREAKSRDLLINTLPVSVFPRFANILIEERLVTRDMLVMDANYEHESHFLEKARLAGVKAIDGLEMLIEQAAYSFKLWTGLDAPIDVMRQAAISERASR